MSRRKRQVRPYLTTRSLQPENQETPIRFLKEERSEFLFFRRNHFPYPDPDIQFPSLTVEGGVHCPRVFHPGELLSMPARSLKVVLECSGNQRTRFYPPVFGEQWEEGAISQGIWSGVPLSVLLERTGWAKEAKEVVFEGMDRGKRTGMDRIPKGPPIPPNGPPTRQKPSKFTKLTCIWRINRH
ncbi:molybdopterin-dependent oxidoreductase-like protein [Melghirimyces profundicolus]|uniref:Molybdopterin-dependent oxidoreductase-like protein n=1 Tax=Melghirimyces profundicolus TaxID=1242148 RepID=A0A2T6BG93_9BACL|nr:molybdopterin-dependent oxidoreductase-like protein [Melghirimyces profundicolus]